MKLSSAVINKLVSLCCSKLEINLIIYLARFQMDNGFIPNLYYKDIISFLDCNTSTFYRLLYKLESKGIISYNISEKYGYYNITILDNDFSDKEFIGKKYINVNKWVLGDDFFKLKATSMYAILKILLRDNGKQNEIKVSDKYLADYANISEKNKKIIERILNNIKELKCADNNNIFNVFSDNRRNGNVHFFIVKYNPSMYDSETKYMQNGMFKRFCNKNKVTYSKQDMNDLIQMDNQYKWCNKYYKDVVKEVCLYYGEVVAKVIRKKMDGIVNAIASNTFGEDKFEAII